MAGKAHWVDRHGTIYIRIERTPDRDEPQRKSKGKKSSLGVCEFIALLFYVNESLPLHRKMTDAEIERLIVEEFPDRPAGRQIFLGKKHAGYWRSQYNAGRLTMREGKAVIPTVLSSRYNDRGQKVNIRTGFPIVLDGPPVEQVEDFMEEMANDHQATVEKVRNANADKPKGKP